MRSVTSITVLASLVCGAYFVYHHVGSADAGQSSNVERKEDPGPRVKVAAAVRGSLEQTFSAYGDILARRQTEIASQIDGRVERVAVEDGAVVAEGQVLLMLDAAVADAACKAAQAVLDAAKADFARASDLNKRGISTSLDLEAANVKLAVATSEFALKDAERQRYTIRAPFSGQITRIPLPAGSLVGAGKPLTEIYDQSSLRVEFRGPERLWTKLKTGQSFEIQIDGDSKVTAHGTVSYVAPDADPRSHSLLVAGIIDNRDRRFAPGLFVHIRLDLGEKSNVILVPQEAVVERLSGGYVFVVQNGKSYERKVILGERRNGLVEVVSGVQPGELVVVRGQKQLRDDMVISLDGGVAANS